MSTIAAGTTTNTALQSTGDTTGNLVFQTNGTTTALTLNTSQAIGVGTSPSYGTSGQALLSGGSSAAPSWGTPSAATSATNLLGGAAGQIPFQTGSGATSFTAAGSSGQVLTSAGTGTPTWSTPSTGAMTLISTQTLPGTSASVTFTSGISTTYTKYMIIYEGVYDANAAGNNFGLQLQFYGNSTTDTNSVYGYGFYYGTVSTGTSTASYTVSITQPSIAIGASSAGGQAYNALNGIIWLDTYYNNTNVTGANYLLNVNYTQQGGYNVQNNNVGGGVYRGSGGLNTTITGFTFTNSNSSANKLVGKISLYGIS